MFLIARCSKALIAFCEDKNGLRLEARTAKPSMAGPATNAALILATDSSESRIHRNAERGPHFGKP